MATRTGEITVSTQDIFPIIKKWLYSEHDIFIRELVANATDAITKRHTYGRLENREIPSGNIQVVVDPSSKTLTISDNGVGMSEAEVEKYLAQLAFSGAKEFVEKMQASGTATQNDVKGDIIGKFGLGFYSAFMVSNKVVVESLSHTENAVPTRWICEGETTYQFEDSQKSDVGTTITLFLNEDSESFTQFWKVQETLKTHCQFMPYTIELSTAEMEKDKPKFEAQIINATKPLWRQNPANLTDEDYKKFYRELFPMGPEPLFWLHLNVDHPFTVQGILYFPKFDFKRPVEERGLKLFCRQVFVSDNVKNIMPDFLGLLKGAIESNDIPLNVSRSALQGDPNVKKLSQFLAKKVAEALKKLAKNENDRYRTIWNDIQVFVKYGSIHDEKFAEIMAPYIMFSDQNGTLIEIQNYSEKINEADREKLKNKILYSIKDKADTTLLQSFTERGIPVLATDEYIDPHYLQQVEMKNFSVQDEAKKIQFVPFENEVETILGSEIVSPDDVKVKDFFSEILGDQKDFELEVKGLGGAAITQSAYIKIDQQARKMRQMMQSMGQNLGQEFPEKKTLVINPRGEVIQHIVQLHSKGEKDLAKKMGQFIKELAILSGEGLRPEEKTAFVKRGQDLLLSIGKS